MTTTLLSLSLPMPPRARVVRAPGIELTQLQCQSCGGWTSFPLTLTSPRSNTPPAYIGGCCIPSYPMARHASTPATATTATA
jgi:hypothetical protein